MTLTGRSNRAAVRSPGVVVYNPAQSVRRPTPPAQPIRSSAFADDPEYRKQLALIAEAQAKQQGGGGGDDNPFGRGLGYIINNPITQTALKPLQYLDYGRRAVTLGMEELAEGITGQEFKSMEGDTRSNWDKLNDPTYGVGQLLGGTIGDLTPWEWDDKWLDRTAGLVGDIAFDPLSYVGGIGFATKGAAAGGRFTRAALMNRVINDARRSGLTDEAIDALTKRLAPVGRGGWAAADKEILEQAGVRGGIRMTTNPLSPYRGAQFTIPGSERVTAPLSRLRTGTGELIGKSRVGRAIQDVRVPNKLPTGTWDSIFREGDQPLDEALTSLDLYQSAKRVGASFAQPFVRTSDRLAHETRNLPHETKLAILDALEDSTKAMPPEGERFRELLDQAWHRATQATDKDGRKLFGLPLPFRQNYSPHILTRDAIAWRRNPANSGKITAPTGFFTEARYDPSGVTMSRRFQVGDEFEVNGVPIKLEKATIREVNEKFRAAGLDFDFFETDPGTIVQKYINMLSDDVGGYVGALDVARRSANRGPITEMPTTAHGTAADKVGRVTLPGGNTVQAGDLDEFARVAGIEGGLNEHQWLVVLDKDATKDVNLATRLRAAKRTKAARAKVTETRNRIEAMLRQTANGVVTYPGAPSLKQVIRDRNVAVTHLSDEVKAANNLVKDLSFEQDAILDRLAWHTGVVRELEQEILPIDILLREIRGSAPKEVVSALDAERRILVDQFEKARAIGEEARDQLATRGTPSRQALEEALDQRVDALYRSVDLEPPARRTPTPERPLSGKRLEGPGRPPVEIAGVGTATPGRDAVDLELEIARKMGTGEGYKGDLDRLSKMTGRSKEEIVADLRRRGVVEKRRTGLPSRKTVRQAIADAKEQVQDSAFAEMERLSPGARPPTAKIAKIDMEQLAQMGKPPKGEWDALLRRVKGYQATKEGRSVYNKMVRVGVLDNVGGAAPFSPDDWAFIMSEAVGRQVTVDEAVDMFFAQAERYVRAGAREPSRDVLEVAAKNLGIEDVNLLAASRSTEAWAEASATYTAAQAARAAEVADLLGGEEIQRILDNNRWLLENAPGDEIGRREALTGELEQAITARGENINDYEDLLNMGTDDLLRQLEQPPTTTAAPTPSPQAVDNPVLGQELPSRVPSEQLAGDYDQLMQLRSQRQALVEQANSVPGLEARVRNTTATRDRLLRTHGFTPDAIPDTMTAQAAVDQVNQRIVNQAQALALDGRIDEAQALTAQMLRSGDDLLAEYDRLTRLIGETQDEIKRAKAAGPELRSEIADLDAQIESASQYIRGHVAEPPESRAARAASQQDQELDRLIARERAGKEAQLRQVPTQGEGNLPNVAPSGTRLHNQDAVHNVGKSSPVVPRPSDQYTNLRVDQNKARTELRNKRKQIDKLRAKVRDDSRVVAARQRAETAMGDAGAVRSGRMLLPERPGAAPKNLKDFPNWDAATEFWTQQVDELIESTPLQGSPAWGMPNKRQKLTEYQQIQKQVGEELGLPGLLNKYKELLDKEWEINNLLGRRFYEADDPAAVAALSKEITGSFDQGELASIGQERLDIPNQINRMNAANQQDKALLDVATRRQEQLAPQIGEVTDQMKEILSNPEAQEALRREALDQPEAQRAIEVRAKKEAERQASATIAAVAQAQLPKATDDLARAQADLAAIAAGHTDASKLAGEARGWLDRVAKLHPKDRGTLPVEDFLRTILDADPGLRSIDNQATVYNILKAEELADEIPDLLATVEKGLLSAKGEHLSRAVDVVLDPTWQMMFPEMGGLGPIIKKDLNKRLTNVKKIANDNKFWRHVDNLTGLFKTYATLSPGFHTRNALSAAFMNASDGVPLSDSVRATRVMHDYGRKNKEGQRAVLDWLEDQKKVVINKETGTTMADALDAVAATGVGGRYREHGIGDRTMAFNRLNERAYANWMTYYIGKRPGTFVESSVRLPVAIDTLRRGGTVEDAMNRITRLHFDYSEVSNFDVAMRRVIPFWTFMSRNFPLQIAQMYTNPRAYAKYNAFIRNFRGEPEKNEPNYFSKIGAFRFMDSEIRGMPVYLQPDLPHTRLQEDLDKATDLLTWENPLRALTDLNPLFTAPAEFATKQDFYTGQRFGDRDYRETGLLEKPLQLLGQFTNQNQTGASGATLTSEAFLNMFRSLNPLYDRSVRMAPQVTTGSNDQNAVNRQVESFLRFVGAPVRQLSPQQQQNEAMRRYYDQRDQMSSERWLASQ